jgi:hypothetical protein
LKGAHQLFAYADDFMSLQKTQYQKESAETLLSAGMEAGLEVNPEKNMYMLMSRIQNIGQKHCIKRGKWSLEVVA